MKPPVTLLVNLTNEADFHIHKKTFWRREVMDIKYWALLLMALLLYYHTVILTILGITEVVVEEKIKEEEENKLDSKTEEFLQALKSRELPWFLQLTEVHKMVKNCVSAIPMGEEAVFLSLDAIDSASHYIADATDKRIVVLNADTCQELILEIDEVLQNMFQLVDDTVNDLRLKLVEVLRALLIALRNQRKYAVAALSNVGEGMRLRYEESAEAVQTALLVVNSTVKEVTHVDAVALAQVPIAKAREIRDCSVALLSGKGKEKNKKVPEKKTAMAMSCLIYALKCVQPFVHRAVLLLGPYLQPTTRPIIIMVMPFWNVAKSLYLIGPYMSKLETKVCFYMHVIRIYCEMSEHIEYTCKYD